MPSMRETMDGWGRQFLREQGFDIPEGTHIEYQDDCIYHPQETWTGGYTDYQVRVYAPSLLSDHSRWRGYPSAVWHGDFGRLIQAMENWEEDQDDTSTS